jgi:hypothetical protein
MDADKKHLTPNILTINFGILSNSQYSEKKKYCIINSLNLNEKEVYQIINLPVEKTGGGSYDAICSCKTGYFLFF